MTFWGLFWLITWTTINIFQWKQFYSIIIVKLHIFCNFQFNIIPNMDFVPQKTFRKTTKKPFHQFAVFSKVRFTFCLIFMGRGQCFSWKKISTSTKITKKTWKTRKNTKIIISCFFLHIIFFVLMFFYSFFQKKSRHWRRNVWASRSDQKVGPLGEPPESTVIPSTLK